MKRLVAACAVGALAAAAVGPLMPHSGSASTLCPQPSVNEIDVGGKPQQHGALNSAVTLKGSGFSSFGCNLSVNINGVGVSDLQAPSSQQITFTLSSATSGMLSVNLTDSTNATNTDNHLVFLTDPSGASLSPTPIYTGSTEQFNGSYFDFHLQPGWEQYTIGYSSNAGGSCPGSPSTPPTLKSATQFSIAMPSQYCNGSANITFTAPCGTNNAVCSGTANTRMSLPTVSAPFDIAPKVSSAPSSGVAGQSAAISGSGFGTSTGTVTINGTSAASSWSDTSISFTIPSYGTSGTLQLVRPDRVTVYQGNFGVSASIAQISPLKAAVGDAVTVSGTGFGPQQSSSGVTVNSTQATITSWTATGIGFTVPAGATTGPVTVTTSGTTSPSSTPTLTVIPKITSFNPAHAAPGALVAIDGTTFGTQQGTVTMGGQAAQVTLWGDQEVLAMVPAELAKGNTTVTVSPPGTDAASAPFSIDAPPPPPPAGSSSSSSSSSSGSHGSPTATPGFIAPNPAGPVIAHGPVAFFKPSPPPGPVSLRLDSAASQADPGSAVKFTVTLMAFGKPIAGAPVDLLMVIEPGADASIDPTHAVTDASGKVQGVIHLSKTPGDHIVLARSGIYSDEIRLVSRSATNTVATARQGGGANPATSTPPLLAVRSPVLWALVTCLLLFGVGFGLNLVTSPAVAGGGAVVADRRRGRGLGGSVAGPLATMGSAARFAAGLVAVLGASVLGRLRGPGS